MAKGKQKYVIQIVGDTAQLVEAFDNATDEAKKLGKNTNKSFSSTAGIIGNTASVATMAGTAIAGTAAAYVGLVASTAQAAREQQILANQAGMTVNAFNALDFAAKQYGMTGEQIADITKDIKDKAQEFARDATGPFQDLANELGLTKSQAQDMAAQMVEMSGDEAIGYMISQMEVAGLTSDQMTQALESMGNDLSRLTPLYKDNGRELERLTDAFQGATLALSDDEIEKFNQLAEKTNLATESFSALAKVMTLEGADTYLDVVSDLTQGMRDYAEQIRAVGIGQATLNVMLGSNFNEAANEAANKVAELRRQLAEYKGVAEKDLPSINPFGKSRNEKFRLQAELAIAESDLDKFRKPIEDAKEEASKAFNIEPAAGAPTPGKPAGSNTARDEGEAAAARKKLLADIHGDELEQLKLSHQAKLEELRAYHASDSEIEQASAELNQQVTEREKQLKQEAHNFVSQLSNSKLSQYESDAAKQQATLDEYHSRGLLSEDEFAAGSLAIAKDLERKKQELKDQAALRAAQISGNEVETLRINNAKKLTQLQSDLDNQLITQAQFNAAKTELDEQVTDKEKQLRDEALAYFAQVQDDKMTLLEMQQQRELNQLQKHHEAALTSEDDYQTALAALRAEHEEQRLTTQEEIDEAENERKAEKTQREVDLSLEARDRANENAQGQLNFDQQIKDKQTAAQVKMGQEMLGELAKQSKEAFQLQKGMRIANAMMNTYEMATGAYNAMASIPVVGPALGAAAAAASIAFGMQQVKVISAQKFQGKAHKGIDAVDSVPGQGDQTWILKGGERVVQPEANKKLTKYLDDNQGNGRKKGVEVVNHFTIQGNVTDEAWFKERLTEHEEFITERITETLMSY